MSTPPKPASASEYTEAEYDVLYRDSCRAALRVLGFLEGQPGISQPNGGVNPQAAGVALLIAMGRLAGRYGFRSIGAEAAWKAWTGDDFRPLFVSAFETERKQED